MEELVCPNDRVETMDLAAFRETGVLAPGATVAGRYRIERRLGGGGMGQVYLATQLSMARPVALKVLWNRVDPKSADVKRFYLEARSASRLTHPNIVRIYDFGVDSETGMPFLAMEYLEGETVRSALKRHGALPERVAAGLLAQAARALVEAHQNGIIHRDLKPENLLIGRWQGTDHVWILDFGIAKVLREPSNPSLTATGAIVGTPAYMSPEQVNGAVLDTKSDLYSLGCILFELVTDRPPFPGHSALTVMYQHVNDAPPPLPARLPNGLVPTQNLRRLVRSLLEKDPAKRPANADVVAAALEAIAPEPTTSSLLPIEASELPEELADTRIHPSAPEPRPKRVLVVDDESALRNALASVLRDAGYEVLVVGTAEAAVSSLSESTVDLILTDLHMPGIGGMGLLTKLSADWPSVPAIVVTAESSVPLAVAAMRTGAADYLVKPFDPADLLAKISNVLAQLR
ncbi:MAG: protein kinase [Deltaproteobacteria bacterium]|nr:protein kinase [Deltaproteobacteria bacterium]